jgi:hypothetical protein
VDEMQINLNLNGATAIILIGINCLLFLSLLSRKYEEAQKGSPRWGEVFRSRDVIDKDIQSPTETDIFFTDNVVKCSVASEKVTEWSYLYKDTAGNQYGCKAVKIFNWALTLSSKEEKIFSQNGEDGVLIEIFAKIGSKDKYFVEFGVEDGSQCNSRVFR